MTRFRLLGEVTIDDRPLKHASVLTVLSLLLLDVNRVVRTERLVDDLWGEALPAKPREALYSYLSRLRAALPPDLAIAQRSGGYVLEADPGSVDLHRFRELVTTAPADDRRRVEVLTEALALWTGEPFTGLEAPGLRAVRPALTAEHLAARLDLHDARLRLGQHAELVPVLQPLAEQHPHDERLARQLLLALTACGRQHEALRRYHALRERLADELGVDPAPETQRVYQQILDGQPAASGVPRELPARPGYFSARTAELAALTEAVAAGRVVISGPGGVGKTALALNWAHDHLDLFPDGQLHLDLLGFTPSGDPVTPADALQRLLVSLGVTKVPDGVDARSALFRSTVADRRMLLVLDNAADSAQVTPLLPGTPSCAVVITSRDRLHGIVTTGGARALPLAGLSTEDARLLLDERLGAARLDADPKAADELLTWCAGLPLALCAVAGHAQMRPSFGLGVLADELRDESDRLHAMDLDDPAASLTVVLSSSYRALEAGQARTFGLLAATPGPDVSLTCAAALTGKSAAKVRSDLRTLERVSLAEEHIPGRWRMHDLVRLYGQAHAAPPDLDESMRRLANFVLHTAAAADRHILPRRRPITLTPCVTEPLAFEDQKAAMAWFDAEYRTLLALQQAADDTTTWQLGWALDSYFYLGTQPHDDYLTALRTGVEAAERLGDPVALLNTHDLLGAKYLAIDAFADGERHLRKALAFAVAQNNEYRQFGTLLTLSHLLQQSGDPRTALDLARDTLPLARALGDPSWEAEAAFTVGMHATRCGEFELAEEHCRAALAIGQEHGDRNAEAHSLASLGAVLLDTGRQHEALPLFERAQVLFRDLARTFYEAQMLEKIGDVHLALGETALAGRFYRQALPLLEERMDTPTGARLLEKIRVRSVQDR